jgi:hypothetical protein
MVWLPCIAQTKSIIFMTDKKNKMTKLIVKRSRELVNMANEYVIYVDGKKKARVGNGKEVKLKLKPGVHVLEARVDDYSSEPIELKIEKGSTKEIVVRSFKYHSFILPAVAILIPGFYFLRSELGISLVYALIFILPVLVYAFYFHTKGKRNYLRWIE